MGAHRAPYVWVRIVAMAIVPHTYGTFARFGLSHVSPICPFPGTISAPVEFYVRLSDEYRLAPKIDHDSLTGDGLSYSFRPAVTGFMWAIIVRKADNYLYLDPNNIAKLKNRFMGVGGTRNVTRDCADTQVPIAAGTVYPRHLVGCEFVSALEYSLFVYVESTDMFGDGQLSTEVSFFAPLTNWFVDAPHFTAKAASNLLRVAFTPSASGRVWAIVTENTRHLVGTGISACVDITNTTSDETGTTNETEGSGKMSLAVQAYYHPLIQIEDLYSQVEYKGQTVLDFENSTVAPMDIKNKNENCAIMGSVNGTIPDAHLDDDYMEYWHLLQSSYQQNGTGAAALENSTYSPYRTCWLNGLVVEVDHVKNPNTFEKPVAFNMTNCGLVFATMYELWVYAEGMDDNTDGYLYRLPFRTMPSNELIQPFNRETVVGSYVADTRPRLSSKTEFDTWWQSVAPASVTYASGVSSNSSFTAEMYGGSVNITLADEMSSGCLYFNRTEEYSLTEFEVVQTDPTTGLVNWFRLKTETPSLGQYAGAGSVLLDPSYSDVLTMYGNYTYTNDTHFCTEYYEPTFFYFTPEIYQKPVYTTVGGSTGNALQVKNNNYVKVERKPEQFGVDVSFKPGSDGKVWVFVVAESNLEKVYGESFIQVAF